MDETFPDYVTYTRPQGGLFILCTIHKDVDLNEVFKKAIEKKVAFVTGNSFMTDIEKKTDCFRLNYSTMDDESIVRGIKILADVLKSI